MADRCEKLKEAQQKNKRISDYEDRGELATMSEELRYHRELHMDSDSEDEDSDDEDDRIAEQRRLRRKVRSATVLVPGSSLPTVLILRAWLSPKLSIAPERRRR